MILLVIIYVAFISLGLPDSVIGSAWPVMHQSLGVQVSGAGVVSMIVAIGTIVSSLFSDKLVNRLGTGKVTLYSVLLTAVALLGISFSTNFVMLCFWAIPLGLGAGSVDATLNNYVALHYEAKHMNWLHSFWGVGTIVGPMIIAYFLSNNGKWNNAYLTISLIQFLFVGILFYALPLWEKNKKTTDEEGLVYHKADLTKKQLMFKGGTWAVLITFFCYSAVEQTVMLWGSSYFVLVHDVSAAHAAGAIALFYIGITIGRVLSGFISMRLTQKQLIRIGQMFIIIGVGVMFIGAKYYLMEMSLLLIGFGCAPIYPSLIHETPRLFGSTNSQKMMGIQMAAAFLGTSLMPPLFGLLANSVGYHVLPIYFTVVSLISVVAVTYVYKLNNNENKYTETKD